MNFMLLTQEDGMIMGPVSKILGWIMEGIFTVIDFIGIPNIGLTIILFTIVVYVLMMPLTIKQQKFSKLSAKMNPELQAIQAKYKNKKDQQSVMAQNQEIQTVYAKYGVSPTGSCMPLLIQMPILFALYRVIYKIPAYVTKIGDTFRVLADKIISVDNAEFLKNSGIETVQSTLDMYGQSIKNGNLRDGVVDVLNRLSSTDLQTIAQHYDLSSLEYEGELILSNATTTGLLDTYNKFLGLNMGDAPSVLVNEGMNTGTWLLVVGALAIPVLAALTQWINTKLIPVQQNNNGNGQVDTMAQSMKTMNTIMPLISAVFCYSMPSGMGLYWIAGSVVRSIQQVIVNKHMDNLDLDEIIQKNAKKSEKKIEKIKANQERMNAYAAMNTRNINTNANPYSYNNSNNSGSNESKTNNNVRSNAKPGSMMAKANMVKDFNEKNNR